MPALKTEPCHKNYINNNKPFQIPCAPRSFLSQFVIQEMYSAKSRNILGVFLNSELNVF